MENESLGRPARKYASAEQLAARFEVTPSTIWRWAKKNIIPQPLKISDGCSRFDIEATDQRIAERNLQPKDVSPAIEASLSSEKRAKALERRRRKARVRNTSDDKRKKS